NDEVYEVFRCPSWQEKLELEILSEDIKGRASEDTVFLYPTIPEKHGEMRITLSSLSIPPLPALNTHFVTNGEEIALWNEQNKIALRCDSREQARELSCSVSHDCVCQPAKLRAICRCSQFSISTEFRDDVKNRLPSRQYCATFVKSKLNNGSVSALISELVAAELLITIKYDMQLVVKELTDSVCTIPDTMVEGCYNCKQGAVGEVTCTGIGRPHRAEIRCGDHYFTVPCSEKGDKSRIRFSSTKARVALQCSVSCGSKSTHFEVTGIPKWVKPFNEVVAMILKGEGTVPEEIVLQDFGHILDTIIFGYKAVALAAVGFLAAILLGYIFFWTCGMKIMSSPVRALVWMIGMSFKAATTILTSILVAFKARACRKSFSMEEQHVKQL
ncbi:unnamed protein product, partial [Nippostrongylus brasiliensis]|uniref:Phlebovirus_G2 domain-containing protein n=1 Tax=Nippostrongylus brasiliensis TaxID=27835 RepID=A0A0N4Y8T0_NIPBR